MIDHLLRFADEAAAQAVLPEYWLPDSTSILGGEVNFGDGSGFWRGDCCIPGVSVYVVTGTETATDPETGTEYDREIRESFAGWFIVIARPELDPALRDLPDGACQLIADREGAVLYTAAGYDPASLVEPTFAGSEYVFGRLTI